MKILITGINSTVGYGVFKSISNINHNKYQIYTADYTSNKIYSKKISKFFLLPDILKKKNVILKTKVLRIINDYKIDLVIPILDFELKFFSILAKNLKDHRTHILIANSKLIDIFLDKEKSSNYFNLINVKQPKTFIQT